MDEDSEPVKVFIRVRPELDELTKLPVGSPLKQQARLAGATNCIGVVDDRTVRLMPPDGVYGVRKAVSAMDDKQYSFDKIFPETSTQDQIYEHVSEHVQATVRGYNTTIFAYGTTGSGKSYTMTGNKANPGIIPRAIGDIFHQIETIASKETDVYFLVRLSYVELYNDKFRNLLENTSKELTASQTKSVNTSQNISGFFPDLEDGESSHFDSQLGTTFAAARQNPAYPSKQHPGFSQRTDKIEVRESSTAGVFLSGQNLRITVTNALEAFQLIAKGNKVRAVGSTNCNENSSRSHAILTIHVESRTVVTSAAGSKSELRLGKIHLVDLAGSERLKMSEAEGERLLETQNINLSLTSLGDVLSALSKNATAQKHNLTASASKKAITALAPVPYRNSKLTHLLKDSLGGNSKTIMITNVRTTAEYFSQTLISLDWSSRAKKVRNKSLVNRNVIGDTGIQQVNSEIERLMARIDERTAEFEKLKLIQMKDARENLGLKNRLQELQMTNEKERKLLEAQVSQVIHSQAGHIQSQRQKINALQSALQEELTESQNRIAEQEKEIKWLQQALKDTQAATEDKDQTQRMQQAIDSWQSRAKQTHQELSTVIGQAEELRALNEEMTSKIRHLEEDNARLTEEVDERTQESVELANSLSQLLMEKQENEKISANELKHTLEGALERETKQMNKISALEAEIRSLKDFTDNERLKSQQHVAHLTKRVADMEKDKAELTNKLTSTIGTLEKKTTQVVEDANLKLVQKESQLKDAEISQQLMNGEVNKLKSQLTELLDLSELKIAARDKNIVELEAALNRELQMSAQLNTQMLSMQSLVDGFKDKNNKLKAKLKESEQSLHAATEKHIAEFEGWVKEQGALKQAMEKERTSLLNEFETTLNKRKAEYERELEKAAKDWNKVREQVEEAHQQELEALHNDFTAKEAQYQKKLAETEVQLHKRMEQEINEHVKQLEAQHAAVTSALTKESAKQLEEALQAQKKILESQLAKAQADAEHEKNFKLEEQKSHYDLKLLKLSEEHQRTLDHHHKSTKQLLQEKIEQTKAEMKVDHDLALEEVNQKKEKKLIKIKSEHEMTAQSIQKKYDDLLRKLEEEIAKNRNDYEQNLMSQQRKYEDLLRKQIDQGFAEKAEGEAALAAQKKTYEKLLSEKEDEIVEWTAAKARLEAQLNKLRTESEAAYKDQQMMYEKLLNDKSEHLANNDRHFEKQLLKHKSDADMSLMAHKQSTERQLAELTERLTEEAQAEKAKALDEQRRKYERQIEKLTSEADESLTNQRKSAEKLLADRLEFLSVEAQIASQAQLDELKQKHEHQLYRLKSESEAALAAQQAAAEKQLEDRIEKLTDDLRLEKQRALDEQKRKYERQIEQMNAQAEESVNQVKRMSDSLMASKVEQVSAEVTEDKQKALDDLKRKYELQLTKLKANLEEDHSHALEVLRSKADEEKRQLARELKQQHEAALAAQVAKHENELLKSMEDVVSSGENERKYALFALEKKKNTELENLEAKHQVQIQGLEKQMKKLEADLVRKHEQELEALENTHREYQNQQDKKILLYKASMEEKTADAIAENTKRLETEYKAKVDELTRREKDLILRHNEALKAADDKYHADLAAALVKERTLLTDKHKLEVDTLKADAKVALQRALMSTESKHSESLSDALESERLQLTEAHNRRLQTLQEEAKRTLEESLLAQKTEIEARAAVDLQILRNKLSSDQLKSESEMRTAHIQEVESLTAKHRRELEDLRSELEGELKLTQDGKDKLIGQLRDQITHITLKSREDLTFALDEQRTELFEKQRVELEKYRSEKHETEARHQEELSQILADHLAELAKQRKNLEAAHAKVVAGLQEDLTSTKDKLYEALSMVTTSEGEGSRQLLEQRLKADEHLRYTVAELENVHRMEVRELESNFDNEVAKLRATNEKLKLKHESDLESRAKEYREEIDRQVAGLNNKFAREIAELKKQHETALTNQLAELTANLSADTNRLREDYSTLISKSTSSTIEFENKIMALTEALAAQGSQFEEYKARVFEENKQRITRLEQKFLEDTSTLESTQQEVEVRLKAKHRQQLQALKEESEREMEKQNAEARAILAKRDEHYQHEITVLKGALTKRETDYRVESAAVEIQLNEARRKATALQSELMELKQNFESEKIALRSSQTEEVTLLNLQHKKEIQRVINELNERHNEEVDRLEDQLAKNQQEFRFQNQLVMNDAAQIKLDLETTHHEQLEELRDLLAAERVRAAQQQQAHVEEVQTLISKFNEERKELHHAKEEAIRNTLSFTESETDKVLSDLKAQHAQELAAEASKLAAEKQRSEEQLQSLAQLQMQKLKDLEEKQAKKLKDLEEKHSEELEALTFDLQSGKDTVKRLRESHGNKMLELENQMELEKASLIQSYEESLKVEAARRESDIKRLKEAHALEMNDIQNRFDSEAKFLRDHLHLQEKESNAKVKELESSAGDQLNELLNLLNKERSLVQQLREENAQHLAQQEAVHREKFAVFGVDTEKRIAAVQERIEKMKEEHKQVLHDSLTAQQETLHQQHQAALNALFLEMQQTKTTQEKAVRDLEHNLSDAKDRIVELTADLERKAAQHSDELNHLREKAKRELEVEKSRLTESFNQTLQLNTDNAKNEISNHEDELKTIHKREIELLTSQFKHDLNTALDTKDKESQLLLKRIEVAEDVQEDLKRQLAKADAVRDSLTVELDHLKAERARLRDQITNLEIEVIDHGKAKFESRLLAEKEKIDKSYQQAFSEVKQEVNHKVEENKALLAKIAQAEMEVASTRAVARFAEEERDRVESMFKNILNEREAAHEVDLRHALESQHDELQGGYLKLIQQQVDSLMLLIQKQSTQHSSAQQVDDLQNRFMALVQDLPDLWKQKHGMFMGSAGSAAKSKSSGGPVTPAKTPLFLLTGDPNNHNHSSHPENKDFDRIYKAKSSSHMQSLPWSSPSLRSSPTDQLIAAILDGDVQGIRAVVRSKGEDLTSEFWRDLSKSVLPLHRAVSGLHFHGSEKLLVSTIEVLTQLGADVNAADHAGNSVLHKAIQVCTSKSVASVVQTLLMRGANASMRNKDGDAPLHAECKRVRSASVEVIEALISAGADPNCKNQHNTAITPLTLVLLRGAASTAVGSGLIGQGEEAAFGLSGALLTHTVDATPGDFDKSSLRHSTAGADSEDKSSSLVGRRVWIKAAEMLVKSGAHWDASWRTPRGCSQLHLFLAAFPPTREDSSTYRSLLKSALEHGLNPLVEDDKGRSSLFVLCEQMAHISSETCPDSNRLMQVVLEATHDTLGGSDRSGRTVLDIEEKVQHSCLSACRQLLGGHSTNGSSGLLSSSTSSRPSSRGPAVSASKDWELERPRSSSSSISLSSSAHTRPPTGASAAASTAGSFKYSGSVEPLRRSHLLHTNGHSSQSHLADSFSVSRNGISHFQDSSMLNQSLSTPLDPVKKKLSASYLEVDDDEDAPSSVGRFASSGTNGHSRGVPSTYLSRK